jgi:hypothetical protein
VNIILACPYGGLHAVRKCLLKRSAEVCAIELDGISSLTVDEITLANGESLRFRDVDCAFIRYPYDLIPPHSESFQKRERTEFLKTVGLLFERVSPNPISACWAMRNRMYSFSRATECGIKVVGGSCIRTSWHPLCGEPDGERVCKALGNCFVCWDTKSIPEPCIDYFSVEEDDGESAVILPAQVAPDDGSFLMDSCGVLFTQNRIVSSTEYRIYVVGSSFFAYERAPVRGVDQSNAPYCETEYAFRQDYVDGLIELQRKTGISYCCYDILKDESGELHLIDINPFGSLPPYDAFGGPTEALADCIFRYASGNAMGI